MHLLHINCATLSAKYAQDICILNHLLSRNFAEFVAKLSDVGCPRPPIGRPSAKVQMAITLEIPNVCALLNEVANRNFNSLLFSICCLQVFSEHYPNHFGSGTTMPAGIIDMVSPVLWKSSTSRAFHAHDTGFHWLPKNAMYVAFYPWGVSWSLSGNAAAQSSALKNAWIQLKILLHVFKVHCMIL